MGFNIGKSYITYIYYIFIIGQIRWFKLFLQLVIGAKFMINSKKLLAFSFLLSIITFGSVSRASDQLLATFSADTNGETYQLTASSSGQVLTSFTVSKVLGDGSIKNREIPINDFRRDGLALFQTGTQNITKIYSHDFNEENGGVIVLESFLKSSTNNEKYYELELAKDQAKWNLLYKGKPITQIHATLGVTGFLDLVMK